MSDTSQIFTDSKVTMTVTVIDKLAIQTVSPSDPIPTKTRELLGIVQWVNHNRGMASVYWETGDITEQSLRLLSLYEPVRKGEGE